MKWAKATNRTLAAGGVAVVVAIAARALSGADTVQVLQVVEIPISGVWIAFMLWTIAHGFVAHSFRSALVRLRASSLDAAQKKGAWEDVISEGGHFVDLLTPEVPEPGGRVEVMSMRDLSTWIALAGAIATFVAIVPWGIDDGLRWPDAGFAYAVSAVALGVVVINWSIGHRWAITIPTLSPPEDGDNASEGEKDSLARFSGTALLVSVAGAVTLAGAAGAVSRWPDGGEPTEVADDEAGTADEEQADDGEETDSNNTDHGQSIDLSETTQLEITATNAAVALEVVTAATAIDRAQIYLRLPGVDSGHDDDGGPLDGADFLIEADHIREYDPMDCDNPKWCWQSASSAVPVHYRDQTEPSAAPLSFEWTVPLEDLTVCLDDAEAIVRLESATNDHQELGPVVLSGIPCPLNEPAYDRTSALSCSPALWAVAAAEWMNTEGVQGSWTDPDGDCIHTAYEINAAGQPACANDADCDDDGIQDGLDPDYDSGGGRLPSFAEQSIYFSD